MSNKTSMFTISNLNGAAKAVESEGPVPASMEGPEGWELLFYTAENVGIDYVVLGCEAGAPVNPLHSGGDVHWLGYVEEGPIELLLGDADGNQTSSEIVKQGDFLNFAPETFHGWAPGRNPAKIIFMKMS